MAALPEHQTAEKLATLADLKTKAAVELDCRRSVDALILAARDLGATHTEIGNAVGVPYDTARMRVKRAQTRQAAVRRQRAA